MLPVAKTHSFLFFPILLPFPDTQDKLDGKQLAPEVWETGAIALGSLVGKLCQQRLRGLQVGPCYTPSSPDPKTPKGFPKHLPGLSSSSFTSSPLPNPTRRWSVALKPSSQG